MNFITVYFLAVPLRVGPALRWRNRQTGFLLQLLASCIGHGKVDKGYRIWYRVAGIRYQENIWWDLVKFRQKFKLLSPLSCPTSDSDGGQLLFWDQNQVSGKQMVGFAKISPEI